MPFVNYVGSNTLRGPPPGRSCRSAVRGGDTDGWQTKRVCLNVPTLSVPSVAELESSSIIDLASPAVPGSGRSSRWCLPREEELFENDFPRILYWRYVTPRVPGLFLNAKSEK